MLSFLVKHFNSRKTLIVLPALLYFFSGHVAIYALPKEEVVVVDTELSLPNVENAMDLMAKYYLNSFVEKREEEQEKKFQTEAELAAELKKLRERKAYDIERPKLTPRERASILILRVYGKHNRAQQDYFYEISPYAVDMRAVMWDTMNILLGSINAPDKSIVNSCLPKGTQQIRTVPMGLFLVTPIADILELQKRQNRTALFVDNPSLKQYLEEQYARVDRLESAFLALYNKKKDPMFSIPYQKGLQEIFPHENGRFVSTWNIELMKRFKFETGACFNFYITVMMIHYGMVL